MFRNRNCPYRHRRYNLYVGAGRKSFLFNRNNSNCYTADYYYLYSNRIERNVQQYRYANCNGKCIADCDSKSRSYDLHWHRYYFDGWRRNYLFMVACNRIIVNYRRFCISQSDYNNNLYSNRIERNVQQYSNSNGVGKSITNSNLYSFTFSSKLRR